MWRDLLDEARTAEDDEDTEKLLVLAICFRRFKQYDDVYTVLKEIEILGDAKLDRFAKSFRHSCELERERHRPLPPREFPRRPTE